MVRMETGILPISYYVLRSCLCWWNKVMSHDNHRLTKLCMNELIKLDMTHNESSPYNWFSRVKMEVLTIGLPYVGNLDCPFNWDYLKLGDIISAYSKILDLERCDNSSYSSFFHKMKSNHFAETYLNYKISLQLKRIFCNMRLHVDRLPFLQIFVNYTAIKFMPTQKCPLCGTDNDDLFHALVSCIHYKCVRPSDFTSISTRLHTHKLFRSYDLESVKMVCNFVYSIIRRRQFLLGE